tara:strand:- start:1896 stop:2372 length:477 start_codon:yes stop_codon:yes gene_type:complete
MSLNFLKILFPLLLFLFLQNCGYQPLLVEEQKKFSINDFEISGDKKLGQMLANRFIRLERSENILMCKIKIEKDRTQSNRDQSGKVLEYSLSMNLSLEAISLLDNKPVLVKGYSERRSYKASKLYSDTLSREKKIIQDLIKSIAEQINNDLNLVYKSR